MDADQFLKTNADFLVTKSTIDPKCDLVKLFTLIRSLKTTGLLCFDLSNGGIRAIRLSEETKARETDREAIRKQLGIIS